jgi:hypothetical protein
MDKFVTKTKRPRTEDGAGAASKLARAAPLPTKRVVGPVVEPSKREAVAAPHHTQQAPDDRVEQIVMVGGCALMEPNKTDLKIKLTDSQRIPFDAVRGGSSVFIGGAAGTGKTTLCKLLIARFRKDLLQRARSELADREAAGQELSVVQQVDFRRGVSVMSSEWKAARGLDKFGTSIHTGMGITPSREHLLFDANGAPTELGARVVRKIAGSVLFGNGYRYPRILIFEECSKVDKDLINTIFKIYRCVRDSLLSMRKPLMFQKGRHSTTLPVYVFLGDHYQLPPILKPGEQLCDNIFYLSDPLQVCIASETAFYLNASVRHPLKSYFEFLERVKRGHETPDDLAFIESRTVRITDPRLQSAMHVCALRDTAKKVGEEFFAKLRTPEGEVRHVFRRSMTFKESPTAGDGGESFQTYKASYERNNPIEFKTVLCPGTYVRTIRPILIEKDEDTEEKDIVPTNTVGYVTGMLVDKVKGVTGVRFRDVKHMLQADIDLVLTGVSLPESEKDVFINVTGFEDSDEITGHAVRDVFIPLAHAYAVTMQSVQGISHYSGYFAIHAYEAWMRQHMYVVLSRLVVKQASDLDNLLIIGRFSRVKALDPCIPALDAMLKQLY